MRLSWNIAIRFLKSGRGQTILIALGIAVGVSAQVFIGSLIGGLQSSLVDRTIGSASHVTIQPEGRAKSFAANLPLLDSLRGDPDLNVASEVFDAAGFIPDGEDSFPVLVRGVVFAEADKIYRFSERLTAGRMPQFSNEILLGSALAESLQAGPGDTVQLSNPQGGLEDWKISGIFDLKVAAINKSWVIADLDAARMLFDPASSMKRLTAIETQVNEVFDADVVAARIRSTLPVGVSITDWKAQNGELLSGLAGQSASSYMIQVFVLLAVGLGIGAVLAVSVVQKSRQLGILKAMGIQDRDASWIFLFQGIILGLVGAFIGTGLGILFTYAFSAFVQNADGTPLVPFSLDYGFIAISVLTALLSATIAALIPARASSRLNPIEVIRNG